MEENTSNLIEPKYLFVILIIILVIGWAYIENDGSRQDIIAHWSERRCDFDVLMASFMYKPPDDTRSSATFAAENFQFCVTSKTTTYLESIFGALFEVLRKQMGASEIMTQVFKVLRVQLNSIYQPFSELMNRFFTKFKQIGSLSSRIFQHLYMSMKKAAASAVASIFIALSLQTAFLNTIDFVIKVIMIVLYILMGLLFIFFLPILPLLALVLVTVAGIETAMPGSTGPMGSVFCFHKDTNVIMKSGIKRNICLLKPGDVLDNDTLVQAIVEVPGEQLYNLDNVLVSGYHCLYHNDEVIYVKDHPRSVKTDKKEDTLWTLITDKREIPVMGSNGILRFLDWDEIPDSREAEKAWDGVAYEMLNSTKISGDKINTPTSAPCLDPSLKVWVYQGGWRPLSKVKIGDWIYGKNTWTKVIGKSERIVHTTLCENGCRFSDGNWVLDETNKWKHIEGDTQKVTWKGIQLITSIGYFKIQMSSGEERIVRDFTEVGREQILESHARVEKVLDDLQILNNSIKIKSADNSEDV